MEKQNIDPDQQQADKIQEAEKHHIVNNRKAKKANWFNRGLVIFAIILIVVGVIKLVDYLFFINKYVTTNDAQVDQYVTPIASRVAGYIKEVRFNENQYVHKGDTLVVIDKSELANNLDKAAAELKSTEANVSLNKNAVSTSASNIAIQKARLKAARVEIWKTEKDYKRFQSLLADEAVTAQQFEQAKAAYENAVANYKTIQQEQMSASLATTEQAGKILPVQSSIKEKQASLNNASLYLSYTVITAPYDGWTGKKTIQEGQLVKEGQTLVNIVSEEKWIAANFRETQIGKLDVGNRVKIKVDAYPDKEFYGVIKSFSPASGSKFSLIPQDNATGNFVKIEQRIPLRIEFSPNQDISKLRAGMNVVVNSEK
jgi:membrane fusion protein (multidrug efflux system)